MTWPDLTPYELGLADDPDVTWEIYSAFTMPAAKAADDRWIKMAENQAEDVLLGRWPYSQASAPAQRLVNRYLARREAAARESRGSTLSTSRRQSHPDPSAGIRPSMPTREEYIAQAVEGGLTAQEAAAEYDADLQAGEYTGHLGAYLLAAEAETEAER